MSGSRTSRNGQIEILRFLFCFGVVFCHSRVFAEKGVHTLFLRGSLGVEFFFLVSGYLMAASIMRRSGGALPADLGADTKSFMIRKIRVFYPDFLVAFLIAFAGVFYYEHKYSLIAFLKLASGTIWELTLTFMAGFGSKRVNGCDWYISAMLLAFLVLYPLARRYTKTFIHVIAPAVAVFGLGLIDLLYGSPLSPYTKIGGVVYLGLVRAFAEICLGAALYPLIERLKNADLSKGKKALIGLAEIVLLLMILYYFDRGDDADFACILLITALVVLAFSHQASFSDLLDNRVSIFLGRISLDLYLSNVYWAHMFKKLFLGEVSYAKLLPAYLALTAVSTFITYFAAEWFRKKLLDRLLPAA